jgi:hypothetical protein
VQVAKRRRKVRVSQQQLHRVNVGRVQLLSDQGDCSVRAA